MRATTLGLVITLGLLLQPALAAGGVFSIAMPNDPSTLGAVFTSGNTQGMYTGPALEALLGLAWEDGVLVPTPSLASSWTESDDGLEYTFHLVENARWHDGVPFTSADVKFTFEELTSQFHPIGRTLFANVRQILAPDDYTVTLELNEPFPALLLMLNQGLSTGVIMPKHLYEGTDYVNNPLNFDHVVGTGPYRFVELVRGSHLRYERNDGYWRGTPALDEVIIRIVPEAATRAAMLRAGEVDALPWSGFALSQLAELTSLPDVALAGVPQASASLDKLIFNVRNEYLSNPKVRQAIAFAIDRELIVDLAQEGIALPATSNLSSELGTGYWNPDPPYPRLYPYDPDEADRLLDEAGYPRGSDGTRFTLRLLAGTHQPFQYAIGDIVSQQLQDVGIRVQFEPVDLQAMIDAAYNRWDFDILSATLTGGPVPEIFISRFYQTSSIQQGVTFNNNSGYSNPVLDDLFVEAAGEVDPQKRTQLWYEIQEILATDLPALALFEVPNPMLYRTEFSGVWQSPQAGQGDMRYYKIQRVEP